MHNVLRDTLERLDRATPGPLCDDIPGMTAPKVKHLLNSLVAQLPEDEGYLEVGVHAGATLISALLDNRGAVAWAYDDWREFLDVNGRHPRALLRENLARYKDRLPLRIDVRERNVFSDLGRKDLFERPLGLVFYDGSHLEEDQERFAREIYPHLAPGAILVVDDFGWARVSRGSSNGVNAVAWAQKELHIRYGPGFTPNDTWHFGLGIWYLEKE